MAVEPQGPEGSKPKRPAKKTVAQRSRSSRGKGKVPARGSITATFLRNCQIARDRLSGLTIERTADKHKVSVRTVSDVMADWRTYIPIRISEDVVEYVERELARYEVLFEKLGGIVDSTDSDAEKIRGISEQMRAMKEGIVLRQGTGVLPNDLGDIQVHVDFISVGRRLAEAMDNEQIPLAVQERIMDLVAGEVNGAASRNGS